jgi:hypothetical protein
MAASRKLPDKREASIRQQSADKLSSNHSSTQEGASQFSAYHQDVKRVRLPVRTALDH